MGFELVTGEPITVEVGTHKSKLTFRPMSTKKLMAFMNKYNMADITKEKPEDIAKEISAQIVSLEGVEKQITPELLIDELGMRDFFDIAGAIIGSGVVSEEQEKN